MKLIHCADLHLDSSMTTHLTKEKAKERKAELLASFNRMMEYADRENVSAVLIAGDLFDRKIFRQRHAMQFIMRFRHALR